VLLQSLSPFRFASSETANPEAAIQRKPKSDKEGSGNCLKQFIAFHIESDMEAVLPALLRRE
jgi:hypothetical protein